MVKIYTIYGGKDLDKRTVLSLEWKSEGVMDDERGESVEPMEQVPLIELGEAELKRLVRGWRREAGSWFYRAQTWFVGDYGHIRLCADAASVDATPVAAVASAAQQQTRPLVNAERKCADIIGTVLVHWAGHLRC